MIDWDEVVRKFGPLVWRTTYRLLRNEADSADCFQQTFLAAFQLAAKETIRQWPAALVRLATARAIERLRSKLGPSSKRVEALDQSPEPTGDLSTDPVIAANEAELSEALRLALGKIDATQAQVFCLACLDDLAYREIGKQLGIKENHVGVLLHRAKAALRQELQAFDPSASLTSEVSS
jgi:RNA polymerase sigma-70 factor (ECF subfamily)